MIDWVPPAFLFIFGAFVFAFIKGLPVKIILILIPVIAFANIINMPEGSNYSISFLNNEITFGRVDKLNKVFGYIFVIMAFSGAIFALHLKTKDQHIAAFLYIGSALGVVFAGDYISLFIFWEIMAFASAYLIWARKTKSSKTAGLRYTIIHMIGGQFLFVGTLIHVIKTGSITFDYLGLSGIETYLILIGFGINAAIPPFSAWLSDAYPESTVTGTVFLSAFTSKTAVYVMARAFPGEQILLWAGILMAVYGIVYAIIENDMRRVLSYSIINQVGFMIAGIGIGTELAINGAAAHAFAHILYKALLMMSAGSVLYMTGISKTTRLGGLYKTMPITLFLGCIGAASISAFPLTGGFISKSMIIDAASKEHLYFVWHILMLASAGVFLHAGIKFPWFVFFAKDSGLRPKEPPLNMLIAMGFVAFLCIFIGVWPQVLYRILPYPVDFVPYTAAHVISQLQILMFSGLAFFVLLKFLKRTETISLDTDWIYRKGTTLFLWLVDTQLLRLAGGIKNVIFLNVPRSLMWFIRNPPAVIHMLYDLTIIPFISSDMKVLLKRKYENEKNAYPSHIIHARPIGSSLLFISEFLMAYLIIYLLSK